MSALEDFLEVHGPAIDCVPVSEEAVKRYEGTLPDLLLEHWREVGWCGYGEGLLWIVNPDDLREPLAEWLGEDALNAHPIVRTAFGDIVFWKEGTAFYLDVLEGDVSSIVDDIEVLFFYTLVADGYVEHVLGRKLLRQALPRLGRLTYDECYAFTPALALGGSATAESLERVKLREYLSILAQLRT